MHVDLEWVRAVLRRSPLTRGLDIHVHEQEGGVRLEGIVPSMEDKKLAGSLVLEALTPGAHMVNNLQVSPSAALHQVRVGPVTTYTMRSPARPRPQRLSKVAVVRLPFLQASFANRCS